VSKRNTILFLMIFVLLVVIIVQTGLTADDRIFYGFIALFIVTQIVWLNHYLRKEKLVRNLDRLYPDD
jgi:hypothetical protein